MLFREPAMVGDDRLPQSSQLYFRYDEPERGPAAGAHGALEPAARACGVAAQQEPVAEAVAERRDVDVARVGGSEHLIRRDLSTVEPEAPCVRVLNGHGVGPAIQH